MTANIRDKNSFSCSCLVCFHRSSFSDYYRIWLLLIYYLSISVVTPLPPHTCNVGRYYHNNNNILLNTYPKSLQYWFYSFEIFTHTMQRYWNRMYYCMLLQFLLLKTLHYPGFNCSYEKCQLCNDGCSATYINKTININQTAITLQRNRIRVENKFHWKTIKFLEFADLLSFSRVFWNLCQKLSVYGLLDETSIERMLLKT